MWCTTAGPYKISLPEALEKVLLQIWNFQKVDLTLFDTISVKREQFFILVFYPFFNPYFSNVIDQRMQVKIIFHGVWYMYVCM